MAAFAHRPSRLTFFGALIGMAVLGMTETAVADGTAGTSAQRALSYLSTRRGPEPRADLARYLRYSPSLIESSGTGGSTAPRPSNSTVAGADAAGGVDSAIAPLTTLLQSSGDHEGTSEAVERLAEGYLRTGFGVPRRFHGLVQEGTAPLRAALSTLTRELRATRQRAGVAKVHVAIEEILTKAQESHYLLSKLYDSQFRADALMAATEPPLGDLASSPGLAGRVALCLVQVGRASRTNLRAATETLAQDREDLKRAFDALRSALAVLDTGLERSWSKPTEQVVLADIPGSLKDVYDQVHGAFVNLTEIRRRGPAFDELLKVNFRSATAAIVALTGTPPRGPSSNGTMRRLNESCTAGFDKLRSVLQSLDQEHGRLVAWARAIRGRRAQTVDLPFPPEAVLLEATTSEDGELAAPIVFNPTVQDDCFGPDPLAEAARARDEATVSSPTLGGDETVALERDMRLLDEVEQLLRSGVDLVADPTTAVFVEARHGAGD